MALAIAVSGLQTASSEPELEQNNELQTFKYVLQLLRRSQIVVPQCNCRSEYRRFGFMYAWEF